MFSNSSSGLVLENSLQCYFFDQLNELNKKSLRPLSNEAIFYSSLVMDRFGVVHQLFEEKEGKYTNKSLGIKLMETVHLSKERRKRELKDIGDTALFVSGFFSDSLNGKIIDVRYYQEIGQAAYSKLNSLVPSFYDVDSFYVEFSKSFSNMAFLIELLAKEYSSKNKSKDLLLIA
ncbi:hypothetical protein A9Q84_19865 [Halobacteriovorax marinus]|uniref:Uncharacterized protein n=1 Tax=Halobacteriovorax marinus TaxID=97084 RepID=A0A1Y5F2Q7_9BACT|nr:hypothetical protein A9Q84_19865 [Halobacteriovorax marinus]